MDLQSRCWWQWQTFETLRTQDKFDGVAWLMFSKQTNKKAEDP